MTLDASQRWLQLTTLLLTCQDWDAFGAFAIRRGLLTLPHLPDLGFNVFILDCPGLCCLVPYTLDFLLVPIKLDPSDDATASAAGVIVRSRRLVSSAG